MPFVIERGTNISHWLSQSDARGSERKKRFTRDDVSRLAELGLDHLRLPVDEEQMWDKDNQKESEAWDLLQQGLDWCREENLKAIIDLHILRSHYFVDVKGENTLFTDPAEAKRLGQCWTDLSEELHTRDNDWVAYELMNEAVADDPADWNRVLKVPYNAIREHEAERTIAIGSNRWCQWHTFADLEVPANDKNIILVLHYYNPMLITHYKAEWAHQVRDYTGPIQYPGQPVPQEEFNALTPDLQEKIRDENVPFTIETIEEQFKAPLDKAKELGLPLWCNEFGVVGWVEKDIRKKWYRDFRSKLEEHGIAWSNWDFRGQFGLYDQNNEPTVVIEAMLGND